MISRLLIIFFISLHTYASSYAQEVIKGRVYDENGNGLSLCYVTNVQSETSTVTNAEGFFSITINTVSSVLEFAHLNYDAVVLAMDSIYFIEISLEPKPYTLDEIQVVSENPESELSSDLSSISEVSSIFGENDISKYLMTLPGVSSVNSFDAGFSVRGGATTENQFLVNNMKIADPRHMSTLVTSFDPYVFNSTQIHKSGFPVSYNGYLSSYIDMNTSYTPHENTQAALSLGMVSSSAKVSVPIDEKGKHRLKASARYSYLDVVSDINDVLFTNQLIPNYRIFDYSMSYRGEVSKTWSVEAFSILSQDHMPLELTNGDLHQMNWNSYSFGLTTLGAVGENSFLKIGLAKNREQSDYRLNAINDQEQASILNNTNLLAEYDLSLSLQSSWHVGLRIEHNDYAIKSDEQNFSSNYLYNGYTSWDYYGKRLSTSIGLNLGRLNTIENLDVSPRVKLNYQLSDLELVLDYARTFQYEEYLPFFTVRTAVDIPVPLSDQNEPAYADQLSVGSYLSFNTLKLYAGGFYKNMNHLKEFTADSRLAIDEIEMLEGSGYAYGTELELGLELTRLSLRANYTWTQTRRKFEGINNGTYYKPPFDVNSNVMISGVIRITNQIKFLALWTYSSGIYITIPEGVTIAKDITDPASLVNYIPIYRDRYNYQLPSRHRLDLTIEYTQELKRDAIKFIMGTYNTYNQQNPDFIFLDVEPVDDFFVSFVPKSKVVIPFIPYLSLTYYINYAR